MSEVLHHRLVRYLCVPEGKESEDGRIVRHSQSIITAGDRRILFGIDGHKGGDEKWVYVTGFVLEELSSREANGYWAELIENDADKFIATRAISPSIPLPIYYHTRLGYCGPDEVKKHGTFLARQGLCKIVSGSK